MKTLTFSYNFNNKLSCRAFTTLRLADESRFKIGNQFLVADKKTEYGLFEVRDVKTLRLEDINAWISYIDTGYDQTTCKEMIRTMYKAKQIDWSTQLLNFVLLVKIKEN